MSDDYKAALRSFMERKGRPVQFIESYRSEEEVSPYGWADFSVEDHIFRYERDGSKYVRVPTCAWVVPEGAILTEETYSQFDGTGCDNSNEVGINVAGCRCRCGKHTDVTLRFTGSLGDVLRELFSHPVTKPGITL